MAEVKKSKIVHTNTTRDHQNPNREENIKIVLYSKNICSTIKKRHLKENQGKMEKTNQRMI